MSHFFLASKAAISISGPIAPRAFSDESTSTSLIVSNDLPIPLDVDVVQLMRC